MWERLAQVWLLREYSRLLVQLRGCIFGSGVCGLTRRRALPQQKLDLAARQQRAAENRAAQEEEVSDRVELALRPVFRTLLAC